MGGRDVLGYLTKRLTLGCISLIVVSFVAFSIAYMLPSDPVTSRYPGITEEQRILIRERMGLDQPLLVQYGKYVEDIFKGEFGRSFTTGNSVAHDLGEMIPATLELVFYALIFGLLTGVAAGIVSAVNYGRRLDHVIRLFYLIAQSIPPFWLGVVLIYLLYFHLRIVPPPIGRISLLQGSPEAYTGFFTIDSLIQGRWSTFLAALHQLLLPAFVMGLSVVSPIARITRAAMSEALREDYITFGTALGLRRRVVFGDALRGSMVAIVTTSGFVIANVIAGAAVIETVFAWPGLGRYAIQSLIGSDIAPVSTCILVISVFVITINIVIDLSYLLIDPRTRDVR